MHKERVLLAVKDGWHLQNLGERPSIFVAISLKSLGLVPQYPRLRGTWGMGRNKVGLKKGHANRTLVYYQDMSYKPFTIDLFSSGILCSH